MNIQEFYQCVGGDYKVVTERLMNDTLIRRLLGKFEEDKSYQKLLDAAYDGRIRESFEAAHTLKGVAGNLGLDHLYRSTEKLVEQLRTQTEPVDQELLDAVKKEYENTIKAIQSLN